MLSPDVIRRADAFSGFYFSADPAQRRSQPPLAVLELYFNWKAARGVAATIVRGGLWTSPVPIENDYVAQRAYPMRGSLADEVKRTPLGSGMVAPAQIAYLGRIAASCRDRGITCVYAQGPIYAHYCRHSAVYLAEVAASVGAAGLPVAADTPICMRADEVGNAMDHVKPDLKARYTGRYFERLRPYVIRAREED